MKPRGQYRGPGYQPCFTLHASTGFVRKKFWMPVYDWKLARNYKGQIPAEIGKIEFKTTQVIL